jgi:hypothetical protein
MSMGEQIGFKTSILGHEIDFMVVEPTVVLGSPVANERHSMRVLFDGAQSFEVPMKFGARITPIRGLGLPGLSEMRYPVALASVDGEVGTLADQRTRGDGSFGYSKEYTTLAHGDTISSAWENISTTRNAAVVLFSTGLLTVDFQMSVGFDLGRPKPRDDRALSQVNLWSDFPRISRTGKIFDYSGRTYHDGAWQRPDPCREIGCAAWDWQLQPVNPYFQTTAAAIGPMNTRALQDDDHVLETRTALTLNGQIHGVLGFDRLGPFGLGLDITGGISGTVGQSHVVRDALYAESAAGSAMRGASGLTVRPKTDASVGLLDTKATLKLYLDLPWPIGTVEWDADLFTIPGVTLANYDSEKTDDWGEGATVRIGTGSNASDPTMSPDVHTHLPGGSEIASFGPGHDVASCLTQPPDDHTDPPLCTPAPPTGGPPRANTCLYQIVQTPVAVCSDIAGAVARTGASGDKAACWSKLFQLLCTPTSYEDPALLSHVLDDGTLQTLESNMSSLADVESTCVNAFVPITGDHDTDNAAAKAFVNSFFQMALCDASGRPLRPDEILGPASDTSTKPTAPGTCK